MIETFDKKLLEGKPFIVTQPRPGIDGKQENPIVFVDSWFLDFTGYNVDELLGRNCNFLQDRPATFFPPDGVTEEEEAELTLKAKEVVRSVVATGQPSIVTVVNYTKDGVPFRNTFVIEVHKDKRDNSINFFVARHVDVKPLFKSKVVPQSTQSSSCTSIVPILL